MPGNYKKRSRYRKRRNKGLGKVKKDIKWLKKNVEFRYKDISDGLVECNSSGILTLLSGVPFPSTAAGSNPVNALLEPGTRSGDEITARRISVRGTCVIGPTPTDATVRIMLVRQKSGHGITPTVSELLHSVGQLVHTFRNMDRKTEWHVYADHTFAMETAGFARIPFKFNFKLNHNQRQSGSGEAVTDIQMNGLYLVTMSNLVAGATAPDVTFSSRYYFCDS